MSSETEGSPLISPLEKKKKPNCKLPTYNGTEYTFLLQQGRYGRVRKYWTKARPHSAEKTSNPAVQCSLCRTKVLKSLVYFAHPVLLPATYVSLLGRCLTTLQSPTSWGLPCSPGFTFTALPTISHCLLAGNSLPHVAWPQWLSETAK